MFDSDKESMMKEARVLKNLDGAEGVPKLYGLTEASPAALVMDYCPGVTLETFLKTPSVPERLRAFVATCEAVKEIHEAGYSHKGSHGENVIVDTNNGDIKAHIIDVGFTTILKEEYPMIQRFSLEKDALSIFLLF